MRLPEMWNLSPGDLAARVAIGGGLLALVYRRKHFDPWTMGGAIMGAALVATGLAGSCMLYPWLGFGTPARSACRDRTCSRLG